MKSCICQSYYRRTGEHAEDCLKSQDNAANRIGRWMGYLSLAVMITIIMLIAMFVIAFLINSIIDVLGSMMDN